MAKYAAVALLFLCSLCSLGQTHKTRINFHCQCEDMSGRLFATAFRDLLATSPRYEQVFADSEKGANGKMKYAVVINVVSMDDTTEHDGASTAFSMMLTVNGMYLGHTVETCGGGRAKECATNTLTFIDQTLSN